MARWQYKFFQDGSSLDRLANQQFNAWDGRGHLIALKVSYDEALQAIEAARRVPAKG